MMIRILVICSNVNVPCETKVLNIGLTRIIVDPCSLPFTPPLPSNPIFHQLSIRENIFNFIFNIMLH